MCPKYTVTPASRLEYLQYNIHPSNHTSPSFNTGTETIVQVLKFKHRFGKKKAELDGGESVSAYSIIYLQ